VLWCFLLRLFTYCCRCPFWIILIGVRVIRYGRVHETVKNSEGVYARVDVHTNNCEKGASPLRPWQSKHIVASKDKPQT